MQAQYLILRTPPSIEHAPLYIDNILCKAKLMD